MTLIITGADVERLMTVGECIEAMEIAFKDFANGVAVNRPRVRYLAQHPDPEKRYWANVHVGASPTAGIACVRAGSQVKTIYPPGSPRTSRNENPRPFNWGLVILYSIETAEPLALMHEFELSGMRVGATTGAVVDHAAPKDASVLGLIGSGKQARSSLKAIAAVRPLQHVNVYSPSAEHREALVREFASHNFEIKAVDDPRKAVEGAHVVSCATSSANPVFDGDWLEDGQMVVSIANSDVTHKRNEVDSRTLERGHTILINDWESVTENQQTELTDLIDEGAVHREQIMEIGDLFTGKRSLEETMNSGNGKGILYYKNNSGLAIQFAAAGGIIYKKALAEGNCREIPTELLGSDLRPYLEAGFHPSP